MNLEKIFAKKANAFSLAEIMVGMFVLAFLATITIPSVVSSTAEKVYLNGYKKAFKTVSTICDEYLQQDTNFIESTQESAVAFSKFFIENANVKELYAEAEPTEKSETYSSLKFKGKTYAGAKNPTSVSPTVKIASTPQFWFVTEDNLAYSIIIPEDAKCNEVLNINTAKSLSKTLSSSCLAVVVDTNGLLSNPNTIEDMEDISNEQYIPNLTNDRYYIFIGTNGAAAGNPKHILTAKINSGKSNL